MRGEIPAILGGNQLEKTIYIDDKPVKLKSGAGLPKRYKAQFRRDYFADLMKISKSMGSTKKGKDFLADLSYEDLEHLDMEVIYDIVWAMAKSADRAIPEPQEWLDGFETFPIKEIMTEIKDLISGTIQGTKKN
jgi:hypothetical protein